MVIMTFTLEYQNLRSIRNRSNTFFTNILNANSDIVGVTETWLNSNIFDAELTDGHYKVFRRDRPYENTHTSRGGGCLLLVKKEIIVTRMTEFESNINFVEDIWLQIQTPDGCVYVSIVYITSSSSNSALTIQYLNHLEEVMLSFNCTDKVIILGDFNIRNIDWIQNPNGGLIECNVNGDKAHKLINTLNVCGLYQHSSVLNQDLKVLDLVLATDNLNSISVSRSNTSFVPIDNYHPPTKITVNLSLKYLDEIEHRKLNYRKANYELLGDEIKNKNWNLLNNFTTDIAVEQFYNEINDLIRNYVPLYKKKNRHPFWFSSDLIKMLKKKEKLRQKWKEQKTRESYEKYSNLRAQCKNSIISCQRQHIQHLQANIKKNTKLFWAYSKSKRKTNSYPTAIQYQNTLANTPNDVSQVFSTYFQSTFTTAPPNRSSNNTITNARPNIERPTITEDCVVKILSKLDENKNGGPDGIPSIFWKKLKDFIAYPLSLIFNKSINEGVFPEMFKSGFITPIFKSGDQKQATNYRPVCLLNIIALVFEKCVLAQLQPQINHLISENQHGFMPGRSTNSNLIKIVDSISKVLDDQGEVHCIYTDFSKAFDSVNHNLLLQKLKHFGVSDTLLKWFETYLNNRKLRVIFGGGQSDVFSPPSGVPQGSVLGPFLFNVFINDLTERLLCPFLLFADDLKIYLRIKSYEDTLQLQNDLNTLFQWCSQNALSLNINKCHFIAFTNKNVSIPVTYHINHTPLIQVNQIKDLGVILDSKLKFDKHIEMITNKAYKMLGFINRITKEFTDINCIKLLYNTLVRSHLEYCTSVWNPYTQKQIHCIERVQKLFTRQVFYRLRVPYAPYESRLEHQKMATLEQRRIYYDMCALHYVLNIKFIFENNFVMRNNDYYPNRANVTFIPPNSRLNYGKFSPSTRFQTTYNTLFNSYEALNENIKNFKKIIKRILKMNL